MTKAATKTASRPAARPAAPQRAQPVPSGATKAAQAAAHQGRAPEPPRAGRHDSQPHTDKLDKAPPVPARVAPGGGLQDYGSQTHVPAHMREDVGMGKEGIGREDIEQPRLKLIQGLSPELEQYDDLRPGHFFHTASETIFDQPFKAVPIFADRRYLLWRPRDSGGGILARADDGIHWSPAQGEFEVTLDKKDGGGKVVWKMAKTVQQSGLANWGTMDPNDPNSPPAATLMYNFVLAFPDEPDLMPAVLTFQRSSIKMGRRFNAKLKTNRNPLFGQVFEFSPFDDSNSRGQDFKNITVRGAGLVEDPKLYDLYKQMHLSLKDSGLQIKDIEGLQDDTPGGNEPAEPGEQTGPNRF